MNERLEYVAEFDRDYAKEQIRRSRHPLRRWVKGFYLRNLLRDVRGPAVDFGCGAGQLLARLPVGSIGVEVNTHLIKALNAKGFTVCRANACLQDFELPWIEPGRHRTLVISHVLEHLADPVCAMRVLLSACRRLGVERVIVVVPGTKGFASDHTHKTFIDRAYVHKNFPGGFGGFAVSSISHFPGPWEWIGKYFVFHELKVIFDHQADPR